ncbi:uncharacterized protein [Enoplosus armatus]|uniref:uncharacterized protein n=1 Tax=Enoplosus armatus TaxID=215367 RepID=UPI003996C271
MSVQIYSASGPGGNNASLQGSTVGGSKPLHRFIKGQPKIIGIIVLVLGSSFFIVSIAITSHPSVNHMWTVIPPGFVLGTLFIICGILYIVTAHHPTKKTVSTSLALSIVTILGSCWTLMHVIPDLIHAFSYGRYSEFREDTENDEAVWASHLEAMTVTLEVVFIFYSFVGAIIFIVMSTLAGIAVRSTKSQAIIVMSSTPTETPAE